MDFLSAMFTAGASVNIAQINERNNKRSILAQENANRTAEEIGIYNLVAQLEAERFKKQALIVVSLIVLFVFIIYIQKR